MNALSSRVGRAGEERGRASPPWEGQAEDSRGALKERVKGGLSTHGILLSLNKAGNPAAGWATDAPGRHYAE